MIVTVQFEVTDDKMTSAQLHELLCKAIHEGVQVSSEDAFHVTDIKLIEE